MTLLPVQDHFSVSKRDTNNILFFRFCYFSAYLLTCQALFCLSAKKRYFLLKWAACTHATLASSLFRVCVRLLTARSLLLSWYKPLVYLPPHEKWQRQRQTCTDTHEPIIVPEKSIKRNVTRLFHQSNFSAIEIMGKGTKPFFSKLRKEYL